MPRNRFRLPLRLAVHPLVGDAHRCDPRQQRVRIAPAIRLEGEAVVVEVPAVELDDQSLRREVGVDLVAADPGVGQRPWQLEPLAEGEERILEL